MCWSIVSKEVDDKTKLQTLFLINDCYKYIMDLTTTDVVVLSSLQENSTNIDVLFGGDIFWLKFFISLILAKGEYWKLIA
jgi:hypothetical protein